MDATTIAYDGTVQAVDLLQVKAIFIDIKLLKSKA